MSDKRISVLEDEVEVTKNIIVDQTREISELKKDNASLSRQVSESRMKIKERIDELFDTRDERKKLENRVQNLETVIEQMAADQQTREERMYKHIQELSIRLTLVIEALAREKAKKRFFFF